MWWVLLKSSEWCLIWTKWVITDIPEYVFCIHMHVSIVFIWNKIHLSFVNSCDIVISHGRHCVSEHCLCWWPGTIGAGTSTATVIICSLSLYTDGLAPCSARASTASKTWQTVRNNTVLADGLAQPGARTPAITLLIWYFVIPTGGLALLDIRASEAIRTLLNLFIWEQ